MTYAVILAPFALLFLVNLLPRSSRARLGYALVLLGCLAQIGLAAAGPPAGFGGPVSVRLEALLGFRLEIDDLSRVLLLSTGVVGAVSLAVGWLTLAEGRPRFNFLNLLLIGLTGLNGLAATRDLFTLYVFIEVTAVATFILVTLQGGSDALEGAFKYLLLSGVATVLMLTAVALLILDGQTLDLAGLQPVIGRTGSALGALAGGESVLARAAWILFLCGLFIKGGLVPFHAWVPDAYSTAPPAVSVLMAGIVTKASGAYGILRLAAAAGGFGPPLTGVLLLVGTVSIVAGALGALGQGSLKRLLAWSSISQVGYILVGVGAGTPLGLWAAAFHFFNHAVSKSQLFVNAAALEEQTGTLELERFGGLGRQMPVTALTTALASLSTAGLPPLAGFWSKLLIIVALWRSGHAVYGLIAVLASGVTLAYFLLLQRRVFFGRPLPELAAVRETGRGLLAPAVALSLLTVGVGLAFPFFLRLVVR